MNKLTTLLLAAATSLGLAFASTAVMAQKAETPKDAKAAAAKKVEPAKPAAEAKDMKDAMKKGEPMDINTASEKELASLKGIGDARAKAIVKGRPYKGKDDLVNKKIIPKNVYEDVKDQIIAKQDMAKKPEPAKKPEEKKK